MERKDKGIEDTLPAFATMLRVSPLTTQAGRIIKEKMMGIILEILGVLTAVAGCVILSLDWKAPVAHKFLIAGVLVFVIGRNSRRIKKLEKSLEEKNEKDLNFYTPEILVCPPKDIEGYRSTQGRGSEDFFR